MTHSRRRFSSGFLSLYLVISHNGRTTKCFHARTLLTAHLEIWLSIFRRHAVISASLLSLYPALRREASIHSHVVLVVRHETSIILVLCPCLLHMLLNIVSSLHKDHIPRDSHAPMHFDRAQGTDTKKNSTSHGKKIEKSRRQQQRQRQRQRHPVHATATVNNTRSLRSKMPTPH